MRLFNNENHNIKICRIFRNFVANLISINTMKFYFIRANIHLNVYKIVFNIFYSF